MQSNTVQRKLIAGDIFNCSDLTKFKSSIVQVLPFKGVSMSKFYICEYDNVRFLTKLCFYHKTAAEIYGKGKYKALSHADAEISILKLFKLNLIDQGVTPCILELVHEKICHGLDKITPKGRICEHLMMASADSSPFDDVEHTLCKYRDLAKNKLAHDKCAFLVLEKCDVTFDEYLRRSTYTPLSEIIFKSLLFMIVYTVYGISRVYPGFRHYDLHTENIMLKFDYSFRFNANKPKYLVFVIDGVVYSIPYFGIMPKIIDFGYSMIPEEGVVSLVTEDLHQMYYRSDNDLLFLFHWIHHTLTQTGGDRMGHIDKMLSSLEPTRVYIQYYTEHIRKVEKKIATYHNMVTNPIWDEYRGEYPQSSQIYGEYTVDNVKGRKK